MVRKLDPVPTIVLSPTDKQVLGWAHRNHLLQYFFTRAPGMSKYTLTTLPPTVYASLVQQLRHVYDYSIHNYLAHNPKAASQHTQEHSESSETEEDISDVAQIMVGLGQT